MTGGRGGRRGCTRMHLGDDQWSLTICIPSLYHTHISERWTIYGTSKAAALISLMFKYQYFFKTDDRNSDSGILLFGKMKRQKSSIWDRIFPNCASLLNSVTSVCPAHPSWRLLPPPDSESWWDRGSKTSLAPIHGHRRVNFPRTHVSATHILLQIIDKWERLVNKEANQEVLVSACLCLC